MRISIIIFLLFNATNSLALNLTSGVISRGEYTIRNEEQKTASPIITKIVKANGGKPGLGIAYTNLGSGSDWYRLYSKLVVVGVNTLSETYLGRWFLDTPGPCENKEDCRPPWWSGRWNGDELLEKDIYQSYRLPMSWSDTYAEQSKVDIMGCMQHTPLRYGDVDNDGQNELVIFMPNWNSVDMIISSPQKQATVFAVKLDYNDVIHNDQIKPELVQAKPPEERYQYWQKWVTDRRTTGSLYKGMRSFAKLYTGNFNDAQKTDLLVWRKMYESRLLSDTNPGFTLKSEMFGHYQVVDGEYKLQTTEPDTIKSWLTTNNLTWQKGYPSQSECPGQEGQLIPEMHDPLLNDPDVLK